ncbi:hypothetical protein FJW06_17030 [Mesorhizobium sp. B4-1-3]|uniref:DUF6894 family protein n=1 Tax=Mesorhizobium sp. B4-1-3 TaxID=2589889 RepID=UPI001128E196|nr:hypothetical protein [Mesorhizobium sp. B4-1-3]TPI12462.1 hypothetical protein FJW06_17030 [Mesorhizobium sp. B4-1-3]
MTRFYFHVDNGTFTPDPDGVDLPDLDAARVEAVRAAGEMINDNKQSFWQHMTPWIMNVTDDANRLLFTLQFAAKIPSGDALYIPRTQDNPGSARESKSQETRSGPHIPGGPS